MEAGMDGGREGRRKGGKEGGREGGREGLPMHGDGDALDALDVGAEAPDEGLKFTGSGVAHCVRNIQSSRTLKEGGRERGREREVRKL